MDKAKKSLSYDEIWKLMEEKCNCEDCLNYEWVDDEVGWRCSYSCPPCEIQH